MDISYLACKTKKKNIPVKRSWRERESNLLVQVTK